MDASTVYKAIVAYFEEQGKIVKDGLDLFEADVMDSMGLIELVTFIDQELGVSVEQDDLRIENFRTIMDIVRTVSGRK